MAEDFASHKRYQQLARKVEENAIPKEYKLYKYRLPSIKLDKPLLTIHQQSKSVIESNEMSAVNDWLQKNSGSLKELSYNECVQLLKENTNVANIEDCMSQLITSGSLSIPTEPSLKGIQLLI